MEDGRRRGKTERNSKRAGRKTKKKESCQKVVINFFEKGWKMEEAEENQKGKAEEEIKQELNSSVTSCDKARRGGKIH
jgi:hypothetical protein